MNQNDAIIIERVANGFYVRPYLPGQSLVPCIQSTMVFQDMGYASAARDHQKTKDTLLGFIEDHFPVVPE